MNNLIIILLFILVCLLNPTITNSESENRMYKLQKKILKSVKMI